MAMQRISSALASAAAAAARSGLVPGLNTTPTDRPSERARSATAAGSSATSTWKVTESAPDEANSSKWCVGSSTIRWQSSTPPASWIPGAIERSTTGPMVTGGTKWPSPQSKWKTRHPTASSASICSPSRRKSAA